MFTQPEKEYIKRLLQAQLSLTNDDLRTLISQRREKEVTMNTPKQKGILGKIGSGLMNIGAGAIQAGGELAVGLPGQLSRLAPGDQSADKSSFYNKTQRLLESTKEQQREQGRNTEGLGFGFGKTVGNIAAGSVGAGLVGKGLGALSKTTPAMNLGTKIVANAPRTAKYGSSLLQGLTGQGVTGNISQRVLGGTTAGTREGLGFGLASGQDPRSAMKTGAIIGGSTPVVAQTAKLLGKGVKRAGEALYKTAIRPNVDEAQAIIQATAKNGTMPITRADTALKYGVQGTEKSVGVQGVRAADKLFKQTIAPALKKSKAVHTIDDIFAKVEEKIASTKAVTRKQELMDGLAALKDEFATTGKKIFSTGDLQAEKSALDKFTQTKIFKGKEVADGYNQVKNTLANVMREQVRKDLSKVGLKNAKELYRDYANLAELEKIGIKGITEGGKRGGTGTAIMTLLDKYLTPIRTIGGNTLYRAGKGIEFIGPNKIETLGKFLRKGGYRLVNDILTKV